MSDMNFDGLSGKIITALSPEYNECRQQWNRAIQKYPAVIVYCYNKFDVVNAVTWSKTNGFAIRIRNGGHNYEGYSTGNGVVIIDLSNMNALSIHENLLKAECGVKNNRLYDYVSSFGYPFPGGNCPTVSLCGFTLGGGWGLSCRHFGLGCDSLVELELIDHNGALLTANSEINKDLFWACRGAGGGNFGVIVSMDFALPPKIDKVTFIEFNYPDTNPQMQAQFFDIWQNWLIEADERITLISGIYHSSKDNFAVRGRGLFYGTSEQAKIIMQPFAKLKGLSLNIQEMTFIEAIKKIEDEHPDFEMFKSTGRFVVKPLNTAEILQLVEILRDVPEGSLFSSLTLYALGGRVAEKNSSETAFFYRSAKYIIGLQSVWLNEQDAQTNIRWVDKNFKYLESVTQGSYANFPYGGLADYLEAYYGSNADRLRVIKKKYDPDNVFGFPQSIHQKI